MCGIFLGISSKTDPTHTVHPHQRELVFNRGPDSIQDFNLEINEFRIVGISSVLHLRGDLLTKQPLDSSNFVLQWNGEVFNYCDYDASGKENEDDSLLARNDTQFIFDEFHKKPVEDVLLTIKGPWAFTLIDKINQIVYFGRDYFGRRSLLFNHCNDRLIISSVIAKDKETDENCTEAKSGILYKYFLSTKKFTSSELQFPKYKISDLNLDTSFVNTEIENSYTKEGIDMLYSSVRRRIVHVHSNTIGILFSGGIDSLLLAAITARIIQAENLELSVNLINVAFEQSGLLKSMKMDQATDRYFEAVPDRIGGRIAFTELCSTFPGVVMNFIPLNISQDEYYAEKDRVVELLFPHRTVMDLSLGIVLWFGSRGVKVLATDYKVLLLGMGADEQLGGYSRHLSAFQALNWNGLLNEMQMDLDRLGHRNLGRDDRCLSDRGREARYPFLDENFVKWMCALPLRIKCDLTLPKGEGDKRIFRLMALKLGFSKSVAFRPKKAMQFGAKSAKISSSSCKGDDLLE